MYKKPRIVFDGYNVGPSTKDAIHLRLSRGVIGPTVRFNAEIVCSAWKEHFLANVNNKQALVIYLVDIRKTDVKFCMHKGMQIH